MLFQESPGGILLDDEIEMGFMGIGLGIGWTWVGYRGGSCCDSRLQSTLSDTLIRPWGARVDLQTRVHAQEKAPLVGIPTSSTTWGLEPKRPQLTRTLFGHLISQASPFLHASQRPFAILSPGPSVVAVCLHVQSYLLELSD